MNLRRPYKATAFKAPRATAARIATARSASLKAARGFSNKLASRGEKKTIDLAPASYACNTTGSVTALNLVATGTDYTDRIGRKIQMKSCNIIGHFLPEDSSVSPTLCRVMLIYDKEPNGAALPAITDILKTADSRDQLNLDNRDRFIVLRDMFVALGIQTANTVGSPTDKEIKIYYKLDHETIFKSTAATIAAINSGSLLLVTIGDNAAGAGYNASVSTRVRFLDN